MQLAPGLECSNGRACPPNDNAIINAYLVTTAAFAVVDRSSPKRSTIWAVP